MKTPPAPYAPSVSAAVRRRLFKKGITVIREIYLPDENGTYLIPRRGFSINDNGMGRIVDSPELMKLAWSELH